MSIDAIVIGAGFAGLSAATAMAEQGARVLVLEARATLGGRATAFTDPATGERVDNGQHVLFGCYRETFRFLRRIGADADVRVQPDMSVDVVDRAGHLSRLACPPLPSPLHLLVAVMRWRALDWHDRLAVLRMRKPLAARRAAGSQDPLDGRETVRQWLVRHGQTPRLIELLWEPLAVAALNQSIDVASAAPFATILRELFGANRRDAALAWSLKPLDELYTVPAREFLERRGGAVRTSAPARIVFDQTQDSMKVLVRDDILSAAAVICAVPWYSLPDVFTDPPPAIAAAIDAAARTQASPIVTVNLWFDRSVTDATFIGLPGRTFQWVFDKRLVFGDHASHLSIVASGADAVVTLGNDELTAMALADLRDALPRARAAVVRRSVVVRERRATFSVAPGQPPRPSTRTAVPGLCLAGDWIETGLPATIEGAVVSGHNAAKEILTIDD